MGESKDERKVPSGTKTDGPEALPWKPIGAGEIVWKLCAALIPLKKFEEALGSSGDTVLSVPIDKIESAILDLCQVPRETYGEDVPESEQWSRDEWSGELSDIITSSSSERDYIRVLNRMAEINRDAAREFSERPS